MSRNIVIIGSSGTIGSSLVNIYKKNLEDNIFAFSRGYNFMHASNVVQDHINILDEESIENTVAKYFKENSIDILIVATGLLHNDALFPEKSIRDISLEKFQKLFSINTIAPALIFKHFINSISREKRTILAAFSARVGSISDNKIGGWHSYRASKSALNMIIKNFSIEIGRKYKKSIIVGLHPGTVDSKLSKPFQKNVPSEKLFTGEYSASKIIKVLEDLNIEDTGKCFDFNALEVYP